MTEALEPNKRVGQEIFITGGTGYLGSRLIPRLPERGHRVSALVRPGSPSKPPAGVRAVLGDPFRAVERPLSETVQLEVADIARAGKS